MPTPGQQPQDPQVKLLSACLARARGCRTSKLPMLLPSLPGPDRTGLLTSGLSQAEGMAASGHKRCLQFSSARSAKTPEFGSTDPLAVSSAGCQGGAREPDHRRSCSPALRQCYPCRRPSGPRRPQRRRPQMHSSEAPKQRPVRPCRPAQGQPTANTAIRSTRKAQRHFVWPVQPALVQPTPNRQPTAGQFAALPNAVSPTAGISVDPAPAPKYHGRRCGATRQSLKRRTVPTASVTCTTAVH